MLARLSLALVFLLVAPGLAGAQEGRPLATFDFWDVHAVDAPTGKICWVASRPRQTLPAGVNRSDIIFTVMISPAQGYNNQPHVEMGYPLATEVTIVIDGNHRFAMSVYEGEGAWLPSETEDDLLVAAMRRGRSMVLRARSQRGTNTVDDYSLVGISAALDRAAQECR